MSSWKTFETVPPAYEHIFVYGVKGDWHWIETFPTNADGLFAEHCFWRDEGIRPILWRKRTSPPKKLIDKAMSLQPPKMVDGFMPVNGYRSNHAKPDTSE